MSLDTFASHKPRGRGICLYRLYIILLCSCRALQYSREYIEALRSAFLGTLTRRSTFLCASSKLYGLHFLTSLTRRSTIPLGFHLKHVCVFEAARTFGPVRDPLPVRLRSPDSAMPHVGWRVLTVLPRVVDQGGTATR